MKALRTVTEWKTLFTALPAALERRMREIYGDDDAEIARHLPIWIDALEGFARNYSPDARVFLARASGRVNLLGMHIDHRGGAVNPLAVGDTIFVAEPRSDDLVVLRNANDEFPPHQFSISQELPPDRISDWDKWTIAQYEARLAAGIQADWSNYVKAGVLYLQHLNTTPDGSFAPALKGMNVFATGNVPPRSGLSSSSSIVMASMEGCVYLNDLAISDMELVDAASAAEWYVGTRGGGGDHAAIKFCKAGHIAHLGSAPLTVDLIPLPKDCCIILCDSGVVAAKTAAARNLFNQRVASYELGMLILRKSFPQLTAKMKLLRDVNPTALDVDEGEIYQMLKVLPEVAQRDEISQILSDHEDNLDRIYRTHEAIPEGYRIRGVCLYGLAECARSELAPALLRSGDVESFAELITLSHDGDRVTHLTDGERIPLEKPLSDSRLDTLTADTRSSDRARRENARLFRQPGAYDVSCAELDEMVDVAMTVSGVLAAGLVGAGLGGCIAALVHKDHKDQKGQPDAITTAMEEQYYKPHGLPTMVQQCVGVGGSGVLDVQ